LRKSQDRFVERDQASRHEEDRMFLIEALRIAANLALASISPGGRNV
jgi:hypothetical protein